MRSQKKILSNFSHAILSSSFCLRPDTEQDLADYLSPSQSPMLVRGSGLSYNDSCFNTNGFIIDNKRLNHLISFDQETGIAVCQGGATFKDLFLLHADFIPPVIPGTLHATIAGGIAHDIHGKNNHTSGSFGHHIVWFEILLETGKILCSRDMNSELFYATLAGLGLTGMITQVAIRLQKKSRFVHVQYKKLDSFKKLTESMLTEGINYDYQVAWIDLLNPEPHSILSLANHCDQFNYKQSKSYGIPPLPCRVVTSWNMKLFNRIFFSRSSSSASLTLEQFNNPLDKIKNWNRMYGSHGLIQFQAVFQQEHGTEILKKLLQLIRVHNATPTLAVLKLFTRSGEGLLSFCRPGFTLAIDFIANNQARQAISAMNQMIAEIGGRIYLAKDFFLNPEQYQLMYEHHKQFSQFLKLNNANMHSDLAQRLGIL